MDMLSLNRDALVDLLKTIRLGIGTDITGRPLDEYVTERMILIAKITNFLLKEFGEE